MTILLHKPYLVKVTTKGVSKIPKIWPRGLWMTPLSGVVLPTHFFLSLLLLEEDEKFENSNMENGKTWKLENAKLEDSKI